MSEPHGLNQLPSAALWKRLCSTLYDTLILLAISLFYGAIATGISILLLGNESEAYHPNVSKVPLLLGWIVTLVGFYCFFWLRIGQTVAMKAWRLKLISTNQQPLTLSRCIIRSVLGFLSFSLFGLGYLWALIDKENLCIHDRLTQTKVVQLSKIQS